MLISDFVYTIDKNGNRRGWGVAQYSTPEKHLDDDFTEKFMCGSRRSPTIDCLNTLYICSRMYRYQL